MQLFISSIVYNTASGFLNFSVEYTWFIYTKPKQTANVVKYIISGDYKSWWAGQTAAVVRPVTEDKAVSPPIL